jgi:putative ABC transport system permease protein
VPLFLRRGNPADLQERLRNGGVILGSVLAQRLGLTVGNEVELITETGPRSFPVVGTVTEYTVGGLVVVMDLRVARQFLHVKGADAFVIKTSPETNPEVNTRLQELAQRNGVLFQSLGELIALIEAMIRGIEVSLLLLLVVGVAISMFALVNNLTLNALEQTRELGMLRVIGMTRRQLRRLIFCQAWIIGTISLVTGTLAGIGLSYIVKLCALPVLGYTLDFHVNLRLLGGLVVGTLVLVLVAAWLPAERAARMSVLEAIRYE